MKTPLKETVRGTYDNIPNVCQQGLPGSSKKKLYAFGLGEPLETTDHHVQDFTSTNKNSQPSPYETPQSAFDLPADGPIYCIPDC